MAIPPAPLAIQTVDQSNVILYQEFHVKERHPTTGKELDSAVVARGLVLNTLFEIEHGYVILFYCLNADRLVASPSQEDINGQVRVAVYSPRHEFWDTHILSKIFLNGFLFFHPKTV